MQLVEQLQNRTFVDVKRCGAGQVEPDWRRETQDAKCRDVAAGATVRTAMSGQSLN